MDTTDALDTQGADDTCQTKGCVQPATATCERCKRRFCAAHSGQLVLQRREDQSARSTRGDMLARLPTHTETYTLCAPCRTKPISRDLSTPALPPGIPRGKHPQNT